MRAQSGTYSYCKYSHYVVEWLFLDSLQPLKWFATPYEDEQLYLAPTAAARPAHQSIGKPQLDMGPLKATDEHRIKCRKIPEHATVPTYAL